MMKILGWTYDRLSEKSTYAGLSLIASMFGISISPQIQMLIIEHGLPLLSGGQSLILSHGLPLLTALGGTLGGALIAHKEK